MIFECSDYKTLGAFEIWGNGSDGVVRGGGGGGAWPDCWLRLSIGFSLSKQLNNSCDVRFILSAN